jgi:hypothetical protein
LACHPYNLVPTCLVCNQRKKRDKDPLSKSISGISIRRNLGDIYRLYREEGIAKNAYLEIDFNNSYQSPTIIGLNPRNGYNIRENISTLREIYQIPDGWQEPSEKEAENLFRRLQNFLDSKDSPFDSLEVIDWLDYYLCGILEEWGHQAYAVLTTWLLVQHIREALSVFDSSGKRVGRSAFLEELETLCEEQNPTCSTQLLSKPTVRDRIQKARNWRQQI